MNLKLTNSFLIITLMVSSVKLQNEDLLDSDLVVSTTEAESSAEPVTTITTPNKEEICHMYLNERTTRRYPWMVHLLIEPQCPWVTTKINAAGSIIHPSIIMTVAHKVNSASPDNIQITAGYKHRNQHQFRSIIFPPSVPSEQSTQIISLTSQERKIVKIIIHENYDDDTLANDIALLIVDRPFTSSIRPACLPPLNSNFDNSLCKLLGWRNYLNPKNIDLPIIPHNECQQSLQSIFSKPKYQVELSFVCAGGEGKDSNNYNGGSPLVCPRTHGSDQYYQVGIMAAGVGSGKPTGSPGLFTNIAHLRSWIDEKVKAEGFAL